MRIGGLASGMDTEQIISDLMKAERIPLDKLHQKKQLFEWQRDDYRSMNKTLADYDNFIFDGVFKQSTFTKKNIASSNEAEVAIKNINSTSNQTSTIKVESLAQSAYLTGTGDVRGDVSFDPNGLLIDQRTKLGANFVSDTFTIQSIGPDGTMGTAITFTIDPSKDSLNSIINRINDSEAGVTAFYDNQTGRFSLTAKNTGDVKNSDEIIISGDFLTGSLKLPTDFSTAGPANSRVGTDAKFMINGLSTTRSSNTFQINGFEYNIKAASNTDIRISSSTDTDTIFNSVKEFVNKYNETIDTLNKKVHEERYRKYHPLTDKEKEAMSEKQVELWEEKSKSGMLKNDSILVGSLNQMRSDLYARLGNDTDDINDSYDQLSEIGIKTSTYSDRGKLIIDESKLRDAISKDPNAVYKLFNNDGPTFDSQGVARRLRATIKNTIEKVEERAGNPSRVSSQYTIGKNILSVDKQINSFEDRLVKVENRYWRQFTAMEKALQKANSQSSYLTQQFSGGM
ncbi:MULTISPECIES: flagellar hook-associated protein 2 [unclassified Bacillus (in: firmicutes)]|uniref:flagellar hook-associated protein 2 n=1 Tax=unclassified Bacillus (in: firmicutes) TaxID=185979 RepID=UPI0008EECEB9|nr:MULTISPECIES: flagellar hook-associated protein 2 [unclassified Bacillus (in: firmicutes)]SFB21598.1 flagellar hook-associated protein 2 [Bacillus sp. UNCCL13]SFQ90995.1 flagellar hook-associated protein 2 [Bacillus sp. cl95]